MEFCLEDNHFSDEMSVASAASVYSSSEAEECVNLGNAEDLCDDHEGDLRTAVSDDALSETELNTAFEEEYLVTAPSSSFSCQSSNVSVSVKEKDGCSNLVGQGADSVTSSLSTAITGSISWYSMPPSETTVEVPIKTENEQAIDAVEQLHFRSETIDSVDIQKPKFECQIPTKMESEPAVDVIEQKRLYAENVSSVDIQKPKFGCQTIPEFEKGPINEVIDELLYYIEISSSVEIQKPVLYCCQLLEEISFSDPEQALADQNLESSEYDTAIEA